LSIPHINIGLPAASYMRPLLLHSMYVYESATMSVCEVDRLSIVAQLSPELEVEQAKRLPVCTDTFHANE